jgi:elongation factor P hydroxylase
MQDKQIVLLFNKMFQQTYNTQLIGGGSEPEYIPAADRFSYHRIIYTQDYSASALHEIAHWCIAGEQRRLQHDYGYWYIPDGRNQRQQTEFEWVESKSQALEWIFAKACKHQFMVSVDNLSNVQSQFEGSSHNFKKNIVKHARRYCQGDLNVRASLWSEALYRQSSADVCDDDGSVSLHFLDGAHYCLGALE